MELSDRIFDVFRKKKYSQEKPYMKDQILEKIEFGIFESLPLKLLGYWGVGLKDKPNWAEKATCDYLTELNNEVKEIYDKGIEFIFIIARPYGIFNGVPLKIVENYSREMEVIFKDNGFKYIYLDDIWRKYNISFQKVYDILSHKNKDWWQKIENHQTLEKNAKCVNLRTDIDYVFSAKMFFLIREIESKIIELEFEDSIFHVFSSSRHKSINPDLPTFYFYARKGWSDVPWYIY